MTQQYLTVTALTKYLKRKFDADPYLGRVYLTGEISNFRFRANAHQYFSLKDDHAKISAIMFKSAFQKLKFQPKEGMKVMVVGRISLYENSGSYQIYIEHMEPDGVGALYQALAELREKLGKEGLLKGLNNSCLVIPNESLWLQVLVVLSFGISLRQSKDATQLHNWSFFQPWSKASRRRMTLCGTFSEPMRKAILIR